MIRFISTFLRIILFPIIVVGAVAVCAWLVNHLVPYYLSNEHSYGSIKYTPHGYKKITLLEHTWDSLEIEIGTAQVSLKKASFDLTVLDTNARGLNLQMDELDVRLPEADSSQKGVASDSVSAVMFPKRMKFYFPIRLDIGKGRISQPNEEQKIAQFKSFSFKTLGKEKAAVSADSIQGKFVAHPTKINLQVDFSTSDVKAEGSLYALNDTVDVKVDVPKENMTDVSTQIDMDVDNIDQWTPFEWPENAPQLTNIHVKAKAKANAITKKVQYSGVLKTHVSEVYPLKALDANIEFDGNQENLHVNTKFDNREGGTIELDGELKPNGDVDIYGNVKNMNAQFGPQMMPLDVTIHSAELRGKKLHALLETHHGSNIDANLSFEDEFSIVYTALISPYEPWAIDWSKERLVLAKPTKIYGSFKNARMHALVKFDTIPFAYHITADSMYTVLDLNKDGIVFTEGVIYTPKETFDFTGDVNWSDYAPHTSWKVTQRNGGVGEAYISIIDSTTITCKADNVALTTIPFADFKFNEKLNGNVTGYYNQNFDTNVGELEASVDGEFAPFKLNTFIRARRNGDSVFIDKFEGNHDLNKVQAEGSFILPNDSNPDFNPTGTLPIEIIYAWVSAHEFSIPLLLEPLNDTTFKSGFITGDLAYNQGDGLLGNIDFTDLEFSNIPPQLFNVRKMNMFAQGSKIELNAYLGIGGGGWTGNTQVIVDDVFKPDRHVSVSHNSDNGGNLWAEGFVDTNFTLKGQLKANGSWFIPGSISEAERTDLQVDVTARLREGIRGIIADIRLDSTLYKPPKIGHKFPIKVRGHVENSILDITEMETKNDSGEIVSGKLKFDLDSLRLLDFRFHSDHYSFQTDEHSITGEQIDGTLENSDESVIIKASIPSITYTFHDKTFGDASALGKSSFSLEIPHNKDGIIKNKTINGEVVVDKLVYNKELDIEVTPSSIDKFITMFNNFVLKLRKKEIQEEKISTASPINLSIHITESQTDSIEIITPFAKFPFTFDIWLLGTTNRPLLRGDLGNSNNGFIGVKDLYEFDINSFRISWNNVPWQHGVLEISSQQELPYCNTSNEIEETETCPINLDIQGTITNPQPTPSSNCGNESSSAAIYYNIFLGCIADDSGEATDWNKLAGKAIGKVITKTANRTLGGDYIGDIDMKVMLFNNNSSSDKDSSYFKVPVSLDRWVKDLSLIFGYTQDQSDNPTYEQALEFGVNYTLPVFKEKEYSHKNHLNPSLSLNGLLISKQYITNTGTESNENRIEKNVGINYVYRYWNPCLLRIGKCETYENTDKTQDKGK